MVFSASFSSSSRSSTRPTFQSMFSHMASTARVNVEVFGCGFVGPQLQIGVGEAFVEKLRHLHRRVRRVERQVAEKGPPPVFLDERHRVVGQVVGDEAFAPDQLAVVVKRRIEVAAPVARGEAVVFIEAARVGMIRILAAVVPFAKGAGRVARGLEGVGDGFLVQIQPSRRRWRRRGRRRAGDSGR